MRKLLWSAGLLLAFASGFLARSFLAARSTPRVFSLVEIAKHESLEEPKESESDFEAYQQYLVQIAKNRYVFQVALKAHGETEAKLLESGDFLWVRKSLRVDFVSPRMLRIGLDGGNDDKLLVKLVNKITEAFLMAVAEGEKHDRYARLQQLEKLEEKVKDQELLKKIAQQKVFLDV